MHIYSEKEKKKVIEDLVQHDLEILEDVDVTLLLEEGCVGYNNMSDDELGELHQRYFGDRSNVV